MEGGQGEDETETRVERGVCARAIHKGRGNTKRGERRRARGVARAKRRRGGGCARVVGGGVDQEGWKGEEE